MAPGLMRGAHEEEPIYRRTNGCHASRSRPYVGGRGLQEAQGKRPDLVRLAQALRPARTRGCEATACARGRERQVEAHARRARDGDRHDEGTQSAKVVSPHVRREQVEWVAK